MNIYVLYDNVSNEFAPVFEQNTDAACARALLSSPEINLKIDDLSICQIGQLTDGHALCKVDCDVEEDFISVRKFIELYRPHKFDKEEEGE